MRAARHPRAMTGGSGARLYSCRIISIAQTRSRRRWTWPASACSSRESQCSSPWSPPVPRQDSSPERARCTASHGRRRRGRGRRLARRMRPSHLSRVVRAVCARPRAATSTGWHPGRRNSCRSTRKYTSEVPAAECSAKRAAARSGRSSAAPGTASQSCQDLRALLRRAGCAATSGLPTPSLLRTPRPSRNPMTREMTTPGRHPEMPVQSHKSGRTVDVTAPTAPVRWFFRPRPWTKADATVA
jgi:hypothetical protein